MRYKLVCASCMMAAAVIGAAPAYAEPSGPAECTSSGPPAATSYPGNSATSPGSIFNEPGTNSANGGKGNLASPQKGSNSQYDRACARSTLIRMRSSRTTRGPQETPSELRTQATAPTNRSPKNSRSGCDDLAGTPRMLSRQVLPSPRAVHPFSGSMGLRLCSFVRRSYPL
jgi:hypothetical protein